ncbi:sensor histidine kinase [Neomicrococcus lactis]
MSETSSARPSFWARHAWIIAAIWLFFLIFPLMTVWEFSGSPAIRILGLVSIAAFAGVYLYGFITLPDCLGGHAPKRAWTVFGILCLLPLPTMLVDAANYLSFTPFLISFAAYLLGLRALLVTAALSFAGLVLAGWWLGSVDAVLSLGIAMALVFIVNLMVTQMMRAGQSAEHMRVELARAEERVKLSRDVHDLLGHSLTVVKLKSELAEKLLDAEPARAKKELHEIGEITAQALAGVRATVTGLRGASLSQELLNSQATLEAAGHAVTVSGDPVDVPPAVSVQLGWVIREVTTNILRHAHATEVLISWDVDSLTIEDDGDGWGSIRKDVSGSDAVEGNGLRGIRERLAAVDARLVLSESRFGGALVEVSW